jgi:hypothetical protein
MFFSAMGVLHDRVAGSQASRENGGVSSTSGA